MARQARKRAPSADRILDSALDLAAEHRWSDVTMEMIADASGATLQQVHSKFPSRAALVGAFVRRTTDTVLAGHDFADTGEPVAERLLDVLIRRFDALTPRKAAVRSILRDTVSDPAGMLCALPSFAHAMAWSLEAAGLSASGPLGVIRLKGLAMIYVSAIPVWLRDDTEDLSATMAHLDRRLKRADALMQRFPFRHRRRTAPGESASG